MDSSHRAVIFRNLRVPGTGFILLHIQFAGLIILLSWISLFFSPTESIAQSQESSAEKTPPSRLKEHDQILLQQIRELSRKDLTFSTGKSFLTERDKRLLVRDAIILIHHPEVEILLIGHTDERGSTPFNLRLGVLRGESAKDFLISLGVNPKRIHLVSFGKRSIPGRLLCSEHRENCWRLHRIVHIVGYLPNEVMTFQNAPPPAPSPNSNTRNVTFQGKPSKPGTYLLLPAGKVEVQNVLMYINYSSTQVAQQNFSLFPIVFPASGINIQSIEDDYYIEMLSFFLGVTDKLELEADVPYVYRTQSTITAPVSSTGIPVSGTQSLSNQSGLGLGDIDFGFHYQFNTTPALGGIFLGNVMVKSTSGTNPFTIPVNSTTGLLNDLPTGTGFWSVEPGLSVFFPISPVVFYGNINYIYSFSRDFGGNIGTINPGQATDLSLGGWFSFSQKTIFTVGYDQMTVWAPSENGVQIPLSRTLQMGSILFGGTYNVSQKFFWMVNVAVGVTPDAPNVAITIRFPLFF